MQEPLELNNRPLNKLAKEKLQEVKWEPNPNRLYSQQLLLWALNSGSLQTIPEVEAKIGQMLLWKPKTWMDEVTNLSQEDGVPILTKDKELSPKDLAWMMLDRIESLHRSQTS